MARRLAALLITTGALAVGNVAPVAAAGALAYAFVVIADSADGFDPFEFGCAALNDVGQVAFRTVDEQGDQAVLRGDGAELTIIADDSADEYDFLGRNPSINDAGQVSFAASLDGPGEAIQRGDGVTLTTVATTVGAEYRFFGFDTSINGRGRVAFKAELDDNDQGLFSSRVLGRDRTYYLTSTSEFLGDQSGPSMRGRRVAFTESRDDFSSGAFTIRSGVVTTIVDDSGPVGFVQNPSLGARGRVAVHAFLDEAGEAILAGRGGPLTTVADTAGPFGSFGFETPAQNGNGDVAFTASLDATFEFGLYVGPDPEADRVVGPGDALAGSTVFNVVGCGEAINDAGQVAFQAQLDDGRTVIARADPLG